MSSCADFVANIKKVMASAEGRFSSLIDRVERDANDPLPFYRLADLCRERGNLQLWHQGVDLALMLPHVTHKQIYYRARAKITRDDWSGWMDYEVRQTLPDFEFYGTAYARQLRDRCTAWDGAEDLRDKKLLVSWEQGFGDTIQMLRFIPELSRRARELILAVQPKLVGFVRHNFSTYATVSFGSFDLCPSLACDRYVWSMSLPALIGALPSTICLRAPAPLPRPTHAGHLRVGVCWAGDSEYTKDQQRSVPIAELEPLLARRDTSWYSLQVGDRAADAQAYTLLKKPDRPLVTFADTANFMCSLDYVVSVDTAVCHLAGSLGIPTFLLLNAAAVWRWGLYETTPWYPSILMIRQRTTGSWRSVVSELMSRLDMTSARHYL